MVRRLKASDVEALLKLINRSNFDGNVNRSETGFLLYNYGEDDYRHRLEHFNAYAFGYFIEERLVGIMLTFRLQDYQENPCLYQHEETVINRVIELSEGKHEKHLWGEQVCIDPEARGYGVGAKLLRVTCESMKEEGLHSMYCMVATAPVKNKRMYNSLQSQDIFHHREEIEEDGKVWTIFEMIP